MKKFLFAIIALIGLSSVADAAYPYWWGRNYNRSYNTYYVNRSVSYNYTYTPMTYTYDPYTNLFYAAPYNPYSQFQYNPYQYPQLNYSYNFGQSINYGFHHSDQRFQHHHSK